MALTVTTGTTGGIADASYLKLVTGEGGGAFSAYGPLFFAGVGTSGVSTCLFLRNASSEPTFVRAADAQTSFEFGTTQRA